MKPVNGRCMHWCHVVFLLTHDACIAFTVHAVSNVYNKSTST